MYFFKLLRMDKTNDKLETTAVYKGERAEMFQWLTSMTFYLCVACLRKYIHVIFHSSKEYSQKIYIFQENFTNMINPSVNLHIYHINYLCEDIHITSAAKPMKQQSVCSIELYMHILFLKMPKQKQCWICYPDPEYL